MTVVNLEKLAVELLAIGSLASISNPDNTLEHIYINNNNSLTSQQIASAQAVIAAHNGAIPLGQVDVTTTGAKLIAFINPGNRIGLPRGYWFGIASAPQAITTPATVSLGVIGPNYTDIAAATPLTGFVQDNVIYVPLTTKRNVIKNPVAVFLNVTVAAVSTGVVVAAVKPDIDYL